MVTVLVGQAINLSVLGLTPHRIPLHGMVHDNNFFLLILSGHHIIKEFKYIAIYI